MKKKIAFTTICIALLCTSCADSNTSQKNESINSLDEATVNSSMQETSEVSETTDSTEDSTEDNTEDSTDLPDISSSDPAISDELSDLIKEDDWAVWNSDERYFLFKSDGSGRTHAYPEDIDFTYTVSDGMLNITITNTGETYTMRYSKTDDDTIEFPEENGDKISLKYLPHLKTLTPDSQTALWKDGDTYISAFSDNRILVLSTIINDVGEGNYNIEYNKFSYTRKNGTETTEPEEGTMSEITENCTVVKFAEFDNELRMVTDKPMSALVKNGNSSTWTIDESENSLEITFNSDGTYDIVQTENESGSSAQGRYDINGYFLTLARLADESTHTCTCIPVDENTVKLVSDSASPEITLTYKE